MASATETNSTEMKEGEGLCGICGAKGSSEDLETLPTCQHVVCSACLQKVFSSMMTPSSEQVDTVQCPVAGCENPIDPNDVIMLLLQGTVSAMDPNMDTGVPEEDGDAQKEWKRTISVNSEEEDSASQDSESKEHFLCCQSPVANAVSHVLYACNHSICFNCLRTATNISISTEESLMCPLVTCRKKMKKEDVEGFKKFDPSFSEVFDRLSEKPEKTETSELKNRLLQHIRDQWKLFHSANSQFMNKGSTKSSQEKNSSRPNDREPSTSSSEGSKLTIAKYGMEKETGHEVPYNPQFVVHGLISRVRALLKLKEKEWSRSELFMKKRLQGLDSRFEEVWWEYIRMDLKQSMRSKVSNIGFGEKDVLVVRTPNEEKRSEADVKVAAIEGGKTEKTEEDGIRRCVREAEAEQKAVGWNGEKCLQSRWTEESESSMEAAREEMNKGEIENDRAGVDEAETEENEESTGQPGTRQEAGGTSDK